MRNQDYDPVAEAERQEVLRERRLDNPMEARRCDFCGRSTPDWHDYHHVNCHRRIPGKKGLGSIVDGWCDCALVACEDCCPDCKEEA